MRKEPVYLVAGVAVAVLAIGIPFAIGLRGGDTPEPSDPSESELLRPTGTPTTLLSGEELQSYWDEERRSSAEPPEVTE